MKGEIFMSEYTRNPNNFVGYEYMDITVKREMESIYADSCTNFGWMLEETTPSLNGGLSVKLKFKRDRKIQNKAELNRLQRQFENCAKEIKRLDKSKTAGARATAYGIGIVGMAFMAGSVFSYLVGNMPLCIILAIPSFIGWLTPYFYYRHIQAKKSTQASPLIDQQYDAIYVVCEKANALLSA